MAVVFSAYAPISLSQPPLNVSRLLGMDCAAAKETAKENAMKSRTILRVRIVRFSLRRFLLIERSYLPAPAAVRFSNSASCARAAAASEAFGSYCR